MPVIVGKVKLIGTGITDNIKVQVVDRADPSIIYDSQTFTQPHDGISHPFSLTVPDYQIYQVEIRQMNSGNPTGILIDLYEEDASKIDYEVLEDIEFIVGGAGTYDPQVPDNWVEHPSLKDRAFRIVQRGNGPLLKVEYVYSTVGSNGRATFTDLVLENGMVLFAQIYPKLVTAQTTGTGPWNNEVVITTDTVWDSSLHLDKLLVFRGSGTKVKFTLPNINTFPFNREICFEANGGNQIYGAIESAAGQEIDFRVPNQLATTKVGLAQGEQVRLTRGRNGKWRVGMANWGYDTIGADFLSSGIVSNSMIKDGSDKLKADYWRLWDWVLANAGTSPTVSLATWNTLTAGTFMSRCFFCDKDPDTFIVPDDRAYIYKPIQFGRIPGTKELGQVGQFTDVFKIKAADTSTSDTGTGKIVTGSSGNEPRDSDDITITFNTGKENLINNVGKIPQIKI
jgi:hypothetical protein